MSTFDDITGQRFGRWLVLGRAPNRKRTTRWFCLCDCGIQRAVVATNLRNGTSRSCGCVNIIHGHCRNIASRTYKSWAAMKARCNNPNIPDYKEYGGRGITICARWQTSFENFLEDMGERPPRTSIDLIDNNGNYEPGNCAWKTPKQQANNRRPKRMGSTSPIDSALGSARSKRAPSSC